MVDDYERFEVQLRLGFPLEYEVFRVYEKLPPRSRSSVYRRQILAALTQMASFVESGDVPDASSALYVMARRVGLSDIEISIYLPNFDFALMQSYDISEENLKDNATQNLSVNAGINHADLPQHLHLEQSKTDIKPLTGKFNTSTNNAKESIESEIDNKNSDMNKEDDYLSGVRNLLGWQD